MKNKYNNNDFRLSPKEAMDRLRQILAFIPKSWKKPRKVEKRDVSRDREEESV